MLRRLVEGYPPLRDTISTTVVQRYNLTVDDLPRAEDERACINYEGKLSRDFIMCKGDDVVPLEGEGEGLPPGEEKSDPGEGDVDADIDIIVSGEKSPELVCICARSISLLY
jgi:hypothetical protein